MSALGQKQTSRRPESMSALPPKADVSADIASRPLWAISGHGANVDQFYSATAMDFATDLAASRTKPETLVNWRPFKVIAAIGPASSPKSTGSALIRPLRLGWMTIDRDAKVRKPPVSISSKRSCIDDVETTT